MKEQQKIVFIDRDGVINIEKNYLYKIEDFEFIDGVFESFKYILNHGFKIVIVTNQSGIGRGYYTYEEYQTLTNWIKNQFHNNGIEILGILCCPHSPLEKCNCRKPQIGMIEQLSKDINIDFQNSWMIGDKSSDIEFALNAGILNTIQVKSGHKFDEKESKAKYILDSIKDIQNIF